MTYRPKGGSNHKTDQPKLYIHYISFRLKDKYNIVKTKPSDDNNEFKYII